MGESSGIGQHCTQAPKLSCATAGGIEGTFPSSPLSTPPRTHNCHVAVPLRDMSEALGFNEASRDKRISRRGFFAGAAVLAVGVGKATAQQPATTEEPTHFKIPNEPVLRERMNVRELYDQNIPGIYIESNVRKLFQSLLSDHSHANRPQNLGTPAIVSFDAASGELRHSAPGFRVTHKRRPNDEIVITRPEAELRQLGISVRYIDPQRALHKEIIIVRSLEGELRTIVRGSPAPKAATHTQK